MRRSTLFISLFLALLLVVLIPASALAAKPAFSPFAASGNITYISPGTTFAAGQSDRWRVPERQLSGILNGDINGPFTVTYRANIESVQTQAGNLHGTLTAGAYVLKVNGKIQPLAVVGFMEVAPGIWVPKLQLTIIGHWTFIDGAQGNGDFTASVVFLPTPDGHVAYIIQSSFDLTGHWKP